MFATRNDKLQKVHQELLTKNAEYFETLLAFNVIRQQQVLSAVKQISDIILQRLVTDRERLVSNLLADKKIRTDLYDSRMFGRLKNSDNYLMLDSREIYDDLVSSLQNPDTDLTKIMQIHCVYLYRILPINITSIQHGRLESGAVKMATTQFGICRHSFFKSKLQIETIPHVAALNRFVPDDSASSQQMEKHALPFVGGLSGHTHALIRGVLQLGLTTEESLKEYAVAIFAFLAAGGNHSFHEVAQVVANLTGIPYRPGFYSDILPESLRQTGEYAQLKEEFSHYRI